MRREKEMPADVITWLESQKQVNEIKYLNNLTLFCSMPVRAAKMKMFDSNCEAMFRTAIIPATDIYVAKSAMLGEGLFKRDSLYFFIANTATSFPYGHVFANSGGICLGNIFVPSAVPCHSPAMPLETLFLHNDRNLSHGDSHLKIDEPTAIEIERIMNHNDIQLSEYAKRVISSPGVDIIAYDEIWILSADVAVSRPLPEAIRIMQEVYDLIFKPSASGKKEE